MTLKTEPPISIDHNTINRVYHQHHHHHHYHLHHILDHHHLHIHNQSIFRSHVTSHQQSRLHNVGQTAVAAQPVTPALPDSDQHHQVHDVQITNHHQLVHSRRLTHVIGASQIHLDRELNPAAAAVASTHGRHQATTSNAKSKQRSQIQFLLLSAFAYILSPIDIIPEAIFGIFGILDDLIFLIMCLFCVAIIMLYPLIREVRRTLFDKLGLKQHKCAELDNKNL